MAITNDQTEVTIQDRPGYVILKVGHTERRLTLQEGTVFMSQLKRAIVRAHSREETTQ